MYRVEKLITILVCLIGAFCGTTYGQVLASTSHWKGVLDVNGQSIPLVFHLKQEVSGQWEASFDSPNQMVYDVRFDEVGIVLPKLRLALRAAGIVYDGILQENGEIIKGYWMQGGGKFPLELKKSIAENINRPQTPKAPFPYDVETVEFSNKKAGISLAGTLTLPPNQQNCPAVVLISGSGPQDRDGSILKHKPFLVLADYLTRQGIVVLRVDDRGVGASGGTFHNATSADFATDVSAALTYLQGHPRVNSKKVGLLGHSEGGLIAPMVASSHEEVAFLVLLAAPGYSGAEILKQQNYNLVLQHTKDVPLAKKQAKILGKMYELLLDAATQQKSTKDIIKLLEKDLTKLSAKEKETLAWTEQGLPQLINQLRSPWMQYFLATEPSAYLTKVRCPVLAINGDKDLQVSVDNLKKIRAALKKGKNKQCQILKIENLNHLLQTSSTGEVEEYIKIEETISPKVMTEINTWLKKKRSILKKNRH